jgi:hypothetical protein
MCPVYREYIKPEIKHRDPFMLSDIENKLIRAHSYLL